VEEAEGSGRTASIRAARARASFGIRGTDSVFARFWRFGKQGDATDESFAVMQKLGNAFGELHFSHS